MKLNHIPPIILLMFVFSHPMFGANEGLSCDELVKSDSSIFHLDEEITLNVDPVILVAIPFEGEAEKLKALVDEAGVECITWLENYSDHCKIMVIEWMTTSDIGRCAIEIQDPFEKTLGFSFLYFNY